MTQPINVVVLRGGLEEAECGDCGELLYKTQRKPFRHYSSHSTECGEKPLPAPK